MSSLKYTVIIPAYNSEDTIETCLRSVLDQKGAIVNEAFKVILIDDGSKDNTADVARKFPIEVIRLPKNSGRIVARLTGAIHAPTERLLFLDSRVTIPEDTIASLHRLDAFPAVTGEVANVRESKYRTPLDTLLYLVRRRYYGRSNFPLTDTQLVINKKNFFRAPKGAGMLLIDKALFQRLTPQKTGKDVNDDTMLFHNLVFQENTDLLRTSELRIFYHSRTEMQQVCGWLFERGIRFASFYLVPGAPFFLLAVMIPVILLLLALIGHLLSGALSLPLVPVLVLFLCLAHILISIYLSENFKDFLTVTLLFPCILSVFASGALFYFARRAYRRVARVQAS